MANRLVLLLALACIASTACASRPCSHTKKAEAEGDLIETLLGLVPAAAAAASPLNIIHHSGDCVQTCNDVGSTEPNTDCWGAHVYRCQSNTSILLTKCEGHYLGFHVTEKSMYIGVCEGLVHKFAHWISTCPKTGATSVHFFGKGCLGASSSIMQHLPVPEPVSPSTVTVTMLLEGHAIPTDPALQHLVDALPESPTVELGSYGGAFESRCNGRGGVMYAVKRGKPGQRPMDFGGHASAQFAALKEVVESAVGDAPKELQVDDEDMLPQRAAADDLPPPPHSILASMVQLTRQNTRNEHSLRTSGDANPDHPTCTMTCNGRPPWFGGLWPCWGNLNVTCASPDSAPGAKTMSFSASCKGLWTGALGRMCWGLTLQHSTKSWPMGNADMWGICSGKQGIWARHDEESVAMGGWCHGGSVAHGVVMSRSTDVPSAA